MLGLGSGAAVSLQLRRLADALASDRQLRQRLAGIVAALAEEQTGHP
jgi:hypothetical protein